MLCNTINCTLNSCLNVVFLFRRFLALTVPLYFKFNSGLACTPFIFFTNTFKVYVFFSATWVCQTLHEDWRAIPEEANLIFSLFYFFLSHGFVLNEKVKKKTLKVSWLLHCRPQRDQLINQLVSEVIKQNKITFFLKIILK